MSLLSAPSPPCRPCSISASNLGLEEPDSTKKAMMEEVQGSYSSSALGDKMEQPSPEAEK